MTQPSANNQPAGPPLGSRTNLKLGRLVASHEFVWDGLKLRLGRGRVVATVEPDAKWPGMYRVQCGGELSDMVNLSRAKGAAISIALSELNRPKQDAAAAWLQDREAESTTAESEAAA